MNELVSIEKLYELAQQNTFSIQGIGNLLKGHEERINKIESELVNHGDRLTSFEENERIDGVDAKRIKRAISARVDYLLDITRGAGGIPTKDCIAIDKRFTSRFKRRAYADCKAHSRMGEDYRETKRRDLAEVMDYIENWEPEVTYEGKSGTSAYKQYLIDRDKS